MAFVGSLLGAGQGSDYVAPGAGNSIAPPVNQAEADTAYKQAQNGIDQQQAFANAINAQNGIGNQTQALQQQQGLAAGLAANNGASNLGDAYNQQASLVGALQGQGGIANQSNVFNQQQALASQFQGVANGTGPNPAQMQLNQATATNVANQAALMAGQRGAGANVGLIARQAAQQGAGIQQQAAGQAATLGAQQQIAGMQGLQAQQQALGQTAASQISNQAGQQAQLANIAAQQVSAQQAQQNAVANLATQQVGQQAAATTGVNQTVQSEQQNLLGGIAANQNAQVGNATGQSTANTAIQVQNSKAQQGILGGVFGGAGSFLAKGGVVGSDGKAQPSKPPTAPHRYADGGTIPPPAPGQPSSATGRFLFGSAPAGPTLAPLGGFQNLGSSRDDSNPVNAGTSELTKGVIRQAKGYFNSEPSGSIDIGSQFNGMPQQANLGVNTNLGQGLPQNYVPGQTQFNGGLQAPGGQPESFGLNSNVDFGQGPTSIDSISSGELPEAGAEGAAAGEASTAGEGATAAEGAEGAEATEAAGGIESLGSLGEVAAILAKGGKVPSQALKQGGGVPGQAAVKGAKDSYSNDTVPAMLSPGEIVIPRSITQGPNAPQRAAEFVAALQARSKHKSKAVKR